MWAGILGWGGGPRSGKPEGRGLAGGGGSVKVEAGRWETGALVVEGRRGTLEGVAERIENLGGSAENGRKELTLGGAGEVTSSNLFLKVEVKMGSGLPLMMPASATMFLMVEGDTLWVLGSNSSMSPRDGRGRGPGVDAGRPRGLLWGPVGGRVVHARGGVPAYH